MPNAAERDQGKLLTAQQQQNDFSGNVGFCTCGFYYNKHTHNNIHRISTHNNIHRNGTECNTRYYISFILTGSA